MKRRRLVVLLEGLYWNILAKRRAVLVERWETLTEGENILAKCGDVLAKRGILKKCHALEIRVRRRGCWRCVRRCGKCGIGRDRKSFGEMGAGDFGIERG